jgi:hypothetical protein
MNYCPKCGKKIKQTDFPREAAARAEARAEARDAAGAYQCHIIYSFGNPLIE